MRTDLMAPRVSKLDLFNYTWLTRTISRLNMRKARFRIPQQKPLDGEALALMRTRASETRGSRIEAKENVFHGIDS
jgi:hypothetical protein